MMTLGINIRTEYSVLKSFSPLVRVFGNLIMRPVGESAQRLIQGSLLLNLCVKRHLVNRI